MKTVPKEIQERQIRHFYKADPAYGEGVAKDWICLFRKCHSNTTSTRGAFVILAPRVS